MQSGRDLLLLLKTVETIGLRIDDRTVAGQQIGSEFACGGRSAKAVPGETRRQHEARNLRNRSDNRQ